MSYIFSIIISYLLGSIPFGILVTKLYNKIDLRTVGSGNIGATNVMRVGGLRMAGLVWLLDMAKAFLSVLIGNCLVNSDFGVWCGLVAIIGHCFPVWLKFHGGKGVSTLFGTILATNPLLFVFCGIEWLIVALGTGYSSAGALVAFVLMPVLGFCININTGIAFVLISLLCLFLHRANIFRLLSGTESKIVWKWKK